MLESSFDSLIKKIYGHFKLFSANAFAATQLRIFTVFHLPEAVQLFSKVHFRALLIA